MKIFQTTNNLLCFGAKSLGYSYQEIRDIYPNARALAYHRDLEANQEKDLSENECFSLQIFENSLKSRLFIFRDYSLNITESEKGLRVKAYSFIENPSSCTRLFFQESVLRIAKGIIILAISIFTTY